MKTEKPEWLKLKELHDSEMIPDGFGGQMPRSRGATYGPPESMADQVGDGLIDVNHIMKRFEKMPTLEQLQAAGIPIGATFVDDFIGAPDFEQALQITTIAKNQFALLPAHVRGRFENDPGRFLDFVGNPENSAACIEMGLKKPPEPPKEPETTLKDVVTAVTNAAKGSKKAGKGGDSEET